MGRHRKHPGAEQTRRGQWISPQRILEHATARMIMDAIQDLFPGLSVR